MYGGVTGKASDGLPMSIATCFAGSGHNMLSALFSKAKKGFSELLARRSATHAIVILYRKLSAVGRHEPLFFVSSC